MNPEIRTLSVGALTPVEGEGALHVTLSDSVVESVELNIYEPPRFFEAFLRGRAYTEPPDITARGVRHLPGRLPDQRVKRDRRCLRRNRSPRAGGTAPAAVPRY